MSQNNTLEVLNKNKKDIMLKMEEELEKWLEENPEDRWRKDSKEKLLEMAEKGKMVRGSLIIEINNYYGGKEKEKALKAAAAVELMHTGILMHDDIIDDDTKRRGIDSFRTQYRKLGEEEGINRSQRFGDGMAISAGDIAFFLAQYIISDINSEKGKSNKVMSRFASEFANVGLAELKDVYYGFSSFEPDENEITALYREKTARYTFSMPMEIGGIIAEVDEEEIEKLYNIGQKIGIIFQIKDDELGLFGDEEEIGKNKSSDLDENKKTLHRKRLLEKLNNEKARKIKHKMYEGDLNRQDKEEIISLMEELSVKDEIRNEMKEYAVEINEDLKQLEISDKGKLFLEQITNFCLERKK